ncbi:MULTISPECIES: hypothetical protein [unclassified Gilliamella]|uniref:hypothetical protein n=1 Tax=unclassified Gilliamella TaxID=2685620 RepID=UPI0013084A97|nr:MULTISPECIES: hypothetical protein [unclassified Gilliamella]MWP49367.1 hypothetical protein [Gilliamella sp. Lep-s35]MWP68991.1 hypothetical protein [Gilliamella sp. Lep-s5]MWP77358.1 hypothetical protein [Gilliamella sp. Lep-s21]
MFFKKLSVFIYVSFFSCVSFAQIDNTQSDANKVIDTFLQCDNHFFEQLAKHQNLISQYVDLATTSDNITYIPVESIEKNDKNKVMFKKTLEYRGLKIIGYQNIYIPTDFSGQFFYWGFIFDNTEDEVKNTLNNINWLPYNINVYIANAKIYDRQLKPTVWQDDPYAIDGVISKYGTVNKGLYLELITNNQSSIFCSIQGDLDKEILLTTRPDLKPIIEKQEAERQERIKHYKEKKLKEKEKQKQVQQSQPQTTAKEAA